jgi:hypothetical protein
MMATGKEPSKADMNNFWTVLVGRSKNDPGAQFYKELDQAREKSPMFDQVSNDIRSILMDPNQGVVNPLELRDRLLDKLTRYSNEKSLDSTSYLEGFDESKLDNSLAVVGRANA